jgi:predicted Zn-dependent protease
MTPKAREHANPALRLTLLCTLLSGCATSGAPAPVEQRQVTRGGMHATTPVAAPSARTQRAAQADTAVQLTGLGDDSTAGDAQPGVVAGPNADTEPDAMFRGHESSPAALAGSGPASVPGAEPVDDFAVANPAVVALLSRAERDAAAGRQGASAASLERAIKIEPGNAWLWHRLAQTRLRQNQPGEAAAIAARSNSLAGNDNALRARNWRLIASVHRLRGESVAAQAAQRKAEGLEQGSS